MQSYSTELYSNMNPSECSCSATSCPICSQTTTTTSLEKTQIAAAPMASPNSYPVCTTTGSDRPLHTATIAREEKFLAKEESQNRKLAKNEQSKAQKLMQKAEKEHAKVEKYMDKGKTNAVVKHEAREAELISSSQVHMRAAQTAASHALQFRDQQGLKQPPPETLTTSTTTISSVTARPAQF